MSRYKQHRKKWNDCQRCDLCKQRQHVVLARGSIPCQILLIGEAPGPSEDVFGQPFIGPAGKLLDDMLEQTWENKFRYCLTNLVACIPKGDDGDKFVEPPKEAIERCAPRLREFFAICRPKLLVYVGKLAAKYAPISIWQGDVRTVEACEIVHPAAILRADVTQRGLMYQKVLVTLTDAVSDL